VVLGDDITLKVNNCENLGQSTLVHGSINGKKVTAKLRQWSSYKYGEEIRVAFNRKHFFDKETTNAIR
jgi:multiple sugar transport system ATP-binding protein